MTTKTDNITQRIIDLIIDNHNVTIEEITLDSHFSNDLGFDSLEKVEFILIVEEEFGISVPEDIEETIKTVGDAIEAIQKLLA